MSLLTQLRAVSRPCRAHSRRLFSLSSSLRIELAYQLIEPPAQEKKRSGRPILFMHGFLGNRKNNRSISKALARDLNRDIYIVDLRNHGDSPHAPEHTYSHLADDVDEFIRQHNLGKTVLIGHSMGAKVAMVLALRSPETTAGVIPVDNAPVSARLGSSFQDYIKAMKEISGSHITKQSEADQILSKYEPSVPIRQFLLTNLVRDPESGNKTLKFRVPLEILGSALQEMAEFPFDAAVDADGENADNNNNNNHLPTYTGPTLFVRGLRSNYISDRKIAACKKFFPNAQIVGIDAGHWVISEKSDEFRQAVLKFFRESNVE